MSLGKLALNNVSEPKSPESASRALTDSLSASRVFLDFSRAFSAASGLPIRLRPLGAFRMPASGHPQENPFCALISQSRKACVACLQMQSKLEASASARACTLRCFANLHETLVPLRIGKKVVAYLQTGQVRLDDGRADAFERVYGELLIRKISLDSGRAREAYSRSVKLGREAYQGFVRMLEFLAERMGAEANAIALSRAEKSTNPAVRKAIDYAQKHLERPISLEKVARVCGASTRHLSRIFKQATGLSFIEYLARERVERAKALLVESNARIIDVALCCGFESIAQFNRVFKKVAGQTPSGFRRSEGESGRAAGA